MVVDSTRRKSLIRWQKRAAMWEHGFEQAAEALKARVATRDSALASGKPGPIPTFPPNSHVRSHRIPAC
jgi:hypothetical protein